jgi:hypothetical protein
VHVGRSGSLEGSIADISRTLEQIFNRELHDKQTIGVAGNGFLWRVVRYHNETDSTSDSDMPAYIALTCNHVISDGRSGQALLGALLSDTAIETSGKEKPTIAPSMQATINCRPSLPFMLEQVWYELIVPKLPRFLERKFKMKPCWPFAPPFSHDSDRDNETGKHTFNHIQFSSDALKRLKDCGKANDVKTLQPLLQVAAVVALWISVGGNPSKRDASAHKSKSLHTRHACVVSFCQSTLGHPAITGNYISAVDRGTKCPNDGNVDFWQTVRQYAMSLHSPAARRRASQVMGSLRYIPDRNNQSAEDPLRPTGWEIFFLDRAKREPAESLNVSNLGFYERPPGTIGMAWSQTPILTAPVHVSIIGHDGGLDIDIARVMGAWTDETGYEPLAHFPATYEKVLAVLAEPYQIVDGSKTESTLTFGDIQRMVRGA